MICIVSFNPGAVTDRLRLYCLKEILLEHQESGQEVIAQYFDIADIGITQPAEFFAALEKHVGSGMHFGTRLRPGYPGNNDVIFVTTHFLPFFSEYYQKNINCWPPWYMFNNYKSLGADGISLKIWRYILCAY